ILLPGKPRIGPAPPERPVCAPGVMSFSLDGRPNTLRKGEPAMSAASRPSTQPNRKPRRPASLLVEQLEDRSVPSTFTVLNLHDGGSDSLRAAIAAANANPDADVIRFANGLNGTIALSSQLSVTEDVTINGPRACKITVSGGDVTRVFNV